MAYHSYLSLKKFGDGNSENWNWLVTSTDRDTADTLFRILLENKELKLASTLKIHELNRESSRLWTVDSVTPDIGALLHSALSGANEDAKGTPLSDLVGKIKLYWMGGRITYQWRTIPQQTYVNTDDD
ncbi:hypothetical protein BJX99DRAFT_258931 [Aspergillus californicus]